MKKLVFIILILAACYPVLAQDKNYCHDKESWKEWDELVQKYPHDMDIQMLHEVTKELRREDEKSDLGAVVQFVGRKISKVK